MGFYEKLLGLAIVPFLFVFVIFLSTGFFRRKMNWVVRLLMSINVKINDHTIYFFPFLIFVNLLHVFWYYRGL